MCIGETRMRVLAHGTSTCLVSIGNISLVSLRETPESNKREENSIMTLETPQAQTKPQVSPRRTTAPGVSLRRRLTPYLFLLPFGVLFLLFFIVPIFYALYQSLFRSQRSGLGLGAATVTFNSLGNYADVIHDLNFWTGFCRVLLYG